MLTERNFYRKGHLTSKPGSATRSKESKPGLYPLNLDKKRDGFIYVPKNYDEGKPAALALMLHGAGGTAEHGLGLLKEFADKNNIIIVAPASREGTWDIIVKEAFDADVVFIDQALKIVFSNYNIDPNHIAIGGFSDGASYALSLGLGNGDLFTHIIAFSPGFAYTMEYKGKPLIYISHGTNDKVLPIEHCSRRIVPRLKNQAYEVRYEEFNGEHEIPHAISTKAIDWFL